MTKKFSKFLLTLLVIIMTISSYTVCFAEVDGEKTKSATTSEGEPVITIESAEETSPETTVEEEIYSGDLYLFDNDIVLNKLVDGNVFIFGQNVEISKECQINGNLYVFANKFIFNGSYVADSIFICATSVEYNGTSNNNVYVASTDLKMSYDAIVYRDLKALASTASIKCAVGRDVDLLCNNVDFGSEKDIAAIYGNLRYSANNEIQIPEGVLAGSGTATYTNISEVTTTSASTITNILIGFATCIITTLVICAITKKCTPNFAEKFSNIDLSVTKLLKAFGIGLLSLIIVLGVSILLIISTIGAKLSFILLLLYVVLCLISVPSLTIIITNALKPAFKIEKTSMFYLILVLVSIVLYGVTLIPFVGGVLGFIIKMIAIGLLICPHKALTDEEKAAIKEVKKQAKELIAKKKQEKLAAKEAKKQAKLDETEGPIKENED